MSIFVATEVYVLFQKSVKKIAPQMFRTRGVRSHNYSRSLPMSKVSILSKKANNICFEPKRLIMDQDGLKIVVLDQ